MTSSELKHLYETKRPDGLFFTRNNMKFSGDTMRNYGVHRFTYNGIEYAQLYRRKTTPKGFNNSVWFRLDTMAHSTIDPMEDIL